MKILRSAGFYSLCKALLRYICNLSRNFILRIKIAECYTLFNVSCSLSGNRFDVEWRLGNYFQIANFYWLLNRNIARQVARGILHCAMYEKCVPVFTSCNGFCNKNVGWLYDYKTCYTLHFSWQLVLQQNCDTSCKVYNSASISFKR